MVIKDIAVCLHNCCILENMLTNREGTGYAALGLRCSHNSARALFCAAHNVLFINYIDTTIKLKIWIVCGAYPRSPLTSWSGLFYFDVGSVHGVQSKWKKKKKKKNNNQKTIFSKYADTLPYWSYKFDHIHVSKNCWMSDKMCIPWSDAAFCGVWFGSTLFAQPVCPNTSDNTVEHLQIYMGTVFGCGEWKYFYMWVILCGTTVNSRYLDFTYLE